jgi:hypothetical protein
MTREEWLLKAIEIFRPDFDRVKALPPKIRVSCSWPSKAALSKKRRIGETWDCAASEDGCFEVFISPCLSESPRVLDVLIHELCHCAVGIEAQHGKPFKDVATAMGLTGRMTATVASDDLLARLNDTIAELGEYPHAELSAGTNGDKKQSTRMLKLECPCCGYVIRTTQKWLDSGVPTCPCGAEFTCDCGED